MSTARQIAENFAASMVIFGVCLMGAYAMVMPDPTAEAVSMKAGAEAAVYDRALQVHCVNEFIRAAGDPTPGQLDAAYRDCQ